MINSFVHKSLKAFFTGSKNGSQPAHVGKLRLQLAPLIQAKSPKDLNVSGLRLHELTGDLRDHHSITVNGSWRIVLPFAENGPHDITNGLLLRSDFHKLFDLGMINVTPEHKIEVSPRIREEWFNGKAYYSLHGKELQNLPGSLGERPSKEFLSWHNENRFQ